MDPIKTGNFIQSLRKELKITQTELSDRLEVTNKAVSRWETGDGFPDIQILPKLASVLGVSIDDLLAGEHLGRKKHPDLLLRLKFKNIKAITIALLVTGFILYLGLTYTTYKVWIGVTAMVIITIAAALLLMIASNNHISSSVYDEDDKNLLFEAKRQTVTLGLTLLSMVMVQIIAVGVTGQWANGVFAFGPYALISLVTAILVYGGSCLCFQWQAKTENLPYRISNQRLWIMGLAVLILLSVIFVFQVFRSALMIIAILLYVIHAIYESIKKRRHWADPVMRIVTIAVYVLAPIFTPPSQLLMIIFIVSGGLWFLILLVVFIRGMVKKTYGKGFSYVWQTLFLVVFIIISLLIDALSWSLLIDSLSWGVLPIILNIILISIFIGLIHLMNKQLKETPST